MADRDDRAAGYVEEAAKTLVATSALMLVLVWGLLNAFDLADTGTFLVRSATVVLLLAIVLSVLTVQFIISATMDSSDATPVARTKRVACTFFLAWVSFLVGCGFIGGAIFRIN